MCIHTNCNVNPIYNKLGEKKALYCSNHRLEEMVNVITQTCIHSGCNVIPIYNIAGEKKALYCSAHKLEKMVDVKNKMCIHQICNTRATYNTVGEKKALYCSNHKLEGMVDVKHKSCIHPNCIVRPNYNTILEKKALYCFKHKLKGMVNVENKTCIHPNCNVRPTYNTEGEKKALYCSSHKLEKMVDVQNPMCKTHLCSTIVQKKYDGYCLYCYINLFPDKPVSRNYKTKEYAVVEYVKTKFPALNWITDKTISGGCSKKRPDLLLDLGDQIIIVEIDENQHIDYDCSCENKRIMELSQDLGHTPIIFIRFNPDNYNQSGNNITSCWGLNQSGICVVKKSKKNEWLQRLNILEEQINYWINNKTNKTIEIIQLFYDV